MVSVIVDVTVPDEAAGAIIVGVPVAALSPPERLDDTEEPKAELPLEVEDDVTKLLVVRLPEGEVGLTGTIGLLLEDKGDAKLELEKLDVIEPDVTDGEVFVLLEVVFANAIDDEIAVMMLLGVVLSRTVVVPNGGEIGEGATAELIVEL